MFIADLPKRVLFQPPMEGADTLIVLAGYATPNMASWFIRNLKYTSRKRISIHIYVGMTPRDGISVSVHNGFNEIIKSEMPNTIDSFRCSYLYNTRPVHMNIYLWLKDNEPYKAFAGTASFSQYSFCSDQRELLIDYNPKEAFEYINSIESNSIYCNHAEIDDYVRITSTNPVLDLENNFILNPRDLGLPKIKLSLLARNGEPGITSGINWGHRGKRNRNEAYIPLPSNIAKSGFFPLNKAHFTATTDDGHYMILRVEQQGNKAITTPLGNHNLGEYLRNRLDLPNGAFITRQNLLDYGRSDITFIKFDDEQFYMDFSKPQQTEE